jgi:S-adenosylmethionine hydrolase
VVLAVVDPGVGTERRGVAVEVGGGASVLIGPDNGLLAPCVAMCGGADRAVELNAAAYQLDAPGRTFAGRDVFAPAAAHLCAGVDLAELGTSVDPAGLLPGILPVTRLEGGGLVAEVLWVDRYGNAQLNVDPRELDLLVGDDEPVEVVWNDGARVAHRADAFAGVGVGRVGLVTDSYGLLAVVVDQGSAAAELGLVAGTPVTLRPIADEPVTDDHDADAAGSRTTGIASPGATPVKLSGRAPAGPA